MDKKRSIGTEEKRKQLEAAGIPWPKCECCGLDKVWNAMRSSGGSWNLRCSRRKSWKKAKAKQREDFYYRHEDIMNYGHSRRNKKIKELYK